MSKKQWYNIYASGPYSEVSLIAKIKSKGLAIIIANTLKQTGYTNISIR